MKVDLGGDRERLGGPGLFAGFDPSPDGRFLLVQTVHRPFSYTVPIERFGRKVEVWNLEGKVVKTLADVPLQEAVPVTFGSVPVGPRSAQWRSDAPATLAWVEAQDGGDAGKPADVRDSVFLLAAPFTAEPVTLATLGQRFGGVTWGTGQLALVEDWWWKTRNQRTWIVNPTLARAGQALRSLHRDKLQRPRLLCHPPIAPAEGLVRPGREHYS
jgi:dipeptidyl aminopeptidase/acylaminoacyl peptidase